MLRRSDIDHVLRAAASLIGFTRFVMIGTGAVIAIARQIPVAMMQTEEIDIYAEEATDPDWVSDLIDGSMRRDSQFRRTFGYYGDGVSPSTAVMPSDWRSRADVYVTRMALPARLVRVPTISPSPSFALGARRTRRGCGRHSASVSQRRTASPPCSRRN
jgi:hypothetical protein